MDYLFTTVTVWKLYDYNPVIRRMIMSATKMLCLIFLTCILTCCTMQNVSTQPVSMESVLSAADINTSITVVAPEEWNQFRIGEIVEMSVTSNTNSPLLVKEQDFQVFLRDGDTWTPVQNKYTDFYIYIIPSDGPLAARRIDVFALPELGSRSTPAVIRIIVNGYFYANNVVGEKIQAYVDVTLHP